MEQEIVLELFDRYADMVYCIGLSYLRSPQEAEDVVQSKFIQRTRLTPLKRSLSLGHEGNAQLIGQFLPRDEVVFRGVHQYAVQIKQKRFVKIFSLSVSIWQEGRIPQICGPPHCKSVGSNSFAVRISQRIQ